MFLIMFLMVRFVFLLNAHTFRFESYNCIFNSRHVSQEAFIFRYSLSFAIIKFSLSKFSWFSFLCLFCCNFFFLSSRGIFGCLLIIIGILGIFFSLLNSGVLWLGCFLKFFSSFLFIFLFSILIKLFFLLFFFLYFLFAFYC